MFMTKKEKKRQAGIVGWVFAGLAAYVIIVVGMALINDPANGTPRFASETEQTFHGVGLTEEDITVTFDAGGLIAIVEKLGPDCVIGFGMHEDLLNAFIQLLLGHMTPQAYREFTVSINPEYGEITDEVFRLCGIGPKA